MTTINLNTGENIDLLVFPDGQPHVTIKNVHEDSRVQVICSLTDSVKLIQLLETANAIVRAKAIKHRLVIPYLMGARYDREMIPGSGESVDLFVIANLINSMDFEIVYLYDVHSDASVDAVHHAIRIDNSALVTLYDKEDAVLICPDSGAKRKIKSYLQWNRGITDVVYCEKSRDLSNGNITLNVINPERCTDRNCVIIDDICDGGGTFIAIAKQIKPQHLTLIVTHGIFSKGFVTLDHFFNEIIVSNTYANQYTSSKVKLVNII